MGVKKRLVIRVTVFNVFGLSDSLQTASDSSEQTVCVCWFIRLYISCPDWLTPSPPPFSLSQWVMNGSSMTAD